MLDSTKQALSNTTGVVGVDVFEAPGPWGRGVTVCAWMQHEDIASGRQQALERIQKNLIKSAENSESVYVLGYQSRPFTHTEFGCAAVLGGMHDETKACWDVYTKGYCRRERASQTCRWQHPSPQVPVHIEVRKSQRQ
jgi:hypothetical protein